MTTLSVSTRIDAPKGRVWDTLADIGGIERWSPGVTRSYATSENGSGEGTTRHCDIATGGRKGYLEEKMFDWRDGEGYRVDIYETNMPIKRNVVSFSLEEDGEGTIVTISPDYQLKFGPLGSVLDALVVRRQLRKGMEDMAAGLKHYVETGEPVGYIVPEHAG